jgi:hypothetical protein
VNAGSGAVDSADEIAWESVSMVQTPTLFEWAGGGDAFACLIDKVYDRVERDPL